jgi:hypothetical protein
VYVCVCVCVCVRVRGRGHHFTVMPANYVICTAALLVKMI